MTKKAKAVESAESKEEQVIVETPVTETITETNEEAVVETQADEEIGLPKPKGPKPKTASALADEEIGLPKPKDPKAKSVEGSEETILINDGAEGDAGQNYINDIEVEANDLSAQVSENELVYTDSDIKLQNILADLKTIEENDISFTKSEDLSVAIVHVEQAIKHIGKLRK